MIEENDIIPISIIRHGEDEELVDVRLFYSYEI
jgi:hypothetical protein